MPLWPFSRKRRAAKEGATQPLTDPIQSPTTTRPTSTSVEKPPAFVREPSRKHRRRDQEEAQRTLSRDTLPPAESEKIAPISTAEKENIRPRTRNSSQENITALPMAKRLEQSPHLRAIDTERPAIPYSFGPYAGSQSSVQPQEVMRSPSRPNTLRSKRSVHDGGPPRRQSTKKRRNDPVREEEIRAMSHPVLIPQRSAGTGDSMLRRESKKVRGASGKGSTISLPPAEASVHSSNLSSIVEQRGWEIGGFSIFPRPAVRLSGIPQYVTAGSAPGTSYMTRELSRREEKLPASRSSNRKRQTIGNQVDDLDTSELRLVLERDAKRRERKKKEQQEKLDKKLRSRGGRNRADSDRSQRRREAEAALLRARDIPPPLPSLHPAFRNLPPEERPGTIGMDVTTHEALTGVPISKEDEPPALDPTPNPFEDPVDEPVASPEADDLPHVPGAFSPVGTSIEEPTLETAEAVQMSQPTTVSPISPIDTARSQSLAQATLDSRRTSELISIPSASAIDPKRASEPPREASRRTGAWATFFRRSTLKRSNDAMSPSSEVSFSNTSRESMRNQPLPPHLVNPRPASVQRRRTSDIPGRTLSRFREDLPEFVPLSPPDSRTQSPDVTTAAGFAAAARRGNRATRPVDVPRAHTATRTEGAESPGPGRNDTPVSPSIRGHGLMSASLASIDSEGSWLAGGSAKRQSAQSGLSRSLSKRKQALGTTSYEELGGDRDADYFQRMTPSPDQALQPRPASHASAVLAGASPDEESEYGDDLPRPATPGDPLTVHESVRRKPTLVHRDPRVKSREGLLAEYTGGDTPEEESTTPALGQTGFIGRDSIESRTDQDTDLEPDEQLLQRATSISYTQRGHVRQISAGSARLLDVARKRLSGEAGGSNQPVTPISPVSPVSPMSPAEPAVEKNDA